MHCYGLHERPQNKVYHIYYPFTLGKIAIALLCNWSSLCLWGQDILRSRSVSEGELPSQAEAEKAEDRPEPNLYPLRGTILFYEDPFEHAVPVEDWEVI
jgi:hypothetical protein